jgi:hypothetical protein
MGIFKLLATEDIIELAKEASAGGTVTVAVFWCTLSQRLRVSGMRVDVIVRRDETNGIGTEYTGTESARAVQVNKRTAAHMVRLTGLGSECGFEWLRDCATGDVMNE